MKILDAPSLLSAVEQRSKAYHELQEEMKLVKKALKGVSGLGDGFTGKGADNIKAFYNDLALYTDTYLDFIDMQKAFLDGVKGKLDDESLGGSTFIDEHFLDAQLKQGIQNNKDMVKEQKEALSTIFDDISDLIELQTFSSKKVDEHLDDANKKRKDAIEAIHTLDHVLKTEYEVSEAIEKHLATFYTKMMAATGKGKNAQPMYYDAKAFHETDVYKNHDKIDAQVKAYIKVKKEEKEKRRIKELKEKLNDPSCISVEKYFEIVDEIGYENLSYDQKLYYSQLLQIKAQEEASEVFVDSVKGAAVGLYDVAKDTVVGIYDLVTDPGGAVESVVTAVSHPIETSKAIGKAISDSFEKEVIDGDAYSRSHWFAYATGSLAEIVFGSKGTGAITKTGTTAAKTTVKKGLEQGAKSIDNVTIPNLLPYSPKFQLAGGGKLPYNVFDGENIKNKLLSMAKRLDNSEGNGGHLTSSNKGYKGIDNANDITKLTVDDIPTAKSGNFNKFFNSLTSKELDELWKDKRIRKKIERQLREPGGLHEWHLVSRAPQFKHWNISAEEIKDLRTAITDVKFVNPNGVHGGLGSTKAHNELLAIIDTSSDYDTFVRRLNNWANYRLEGGVSSLPEGLKLK
ncbi:ribonuclease YeeF family protein [Bacillus pumilus]|uniref:ribonuclease YeeF family protein n=1 Tax=Bacillus pumilus TaxID=1408 RepID=UPI00078D5636|nr:T7SS effector LXG polymorphic toxin [Bacillus pumilus]AMM97388.1 dna binding protein [Bacillus pumilus]MDH3151468.1 LXG domain-containing protein [Bacillus pumilus]